MYVDESGDTGLLNSPTRYFVLSSLIVHELRWKELLDSLIEFRRRIRIVKGLKLREEIHASHFITRPGELVRIKRNDRLDILKQCLSWCAIQSTISIITVRIDKQGKTGDVFEHAWELMIQRFENTIRHRNFPGPANPDDRGFIISDNTDGKKLIGLLRRMRKYNPVSNVRGLYTSGYRDLPLDYVIEDPFMKDSQSSYVHQIVDVVAYFAHQLYEPNAYIRKKGAKLFYHLLDPVVQRHASRLHPFGIVEY